LESIQAAKRTLQMLLRHVRIVGADLTHYECYAVI
jgi:hypothetical protein